MKNKRLIAGVAFLSALLGIVPILTGCSNFWKAAATTTTTTLTSTSYSTTAGTDFTLTGTVSSTSATGTIEFYDTTTSTNLGSETVSSGVATLTTSLTAVETHAIEAIYSGDSTYATSTSSTISVVISSASLTSTTTTLTSTSYSTTTGTDFTLTGTVSSTSATGTIEFYDTTTSTNLGSSTVSSGVATLTTSLTAVETHTIEAIYSGDSTYATSTSSTINIVIASSSSSSSTIMLSVSPTTVTYGTGVGLAAIVTPLSSTGTVTFYDGSTSLGTASLVSGSAVAALTLDGSNSLSVGSHSITAVYNSLTSSATTVQVVSATSGSLASDAACGYTTDGATGAQVLATGTLSTSDQTYSTSTADQNAICVTGTSSFLTLIDPTITSSAVTTVDGDSSWYGLNAAVLDYNGGVLTIDGGTVSTSGTGGNMVYSYGTGTITISNATLSSTTTNTSNNHGIYAAGAGTIVANNVTASSAGSSSSIVATDNGGGTVTINGGTYTATGGKSAGIYSTGSVTAYNATFTSTIAEAVVIEGANLVKLYNTTLNAGVDGAADSGTHRGIFLYQSMSGDATNTSCSAGDCFYMTNGTFNFYDTTSSNTDPSNNCSAIAVYDQSSVITLTDVAINNSCGTLLLSGYNDNWSNSDGWGYATLKAYGTTLKGNIIIGDTCLTSACTTRDSTSTGTIYLSEDSTGTGSSLTGSINAANSGSPTVALTLDSASTWTVSATSYLTSLTLASASNIAAPSGKTVTMTVDGTTRAIAAGTFSGTIVLTVE